MMALARCRFRVVSDGRRVGGVAMARSWQKSTETRLLSSARASESSGALEERIRYLSRYKQTGVSLRGLIEAGTTHVVQLGRMGGVLPTPVLLTVASFLHRELPIRLARRVSELDSMPRLSEAKSVRRVRDWYARSVEEIVDAQKPVDAQTEAKFAALLSTIYDRHAAVLITMAKGAHELRSNLGYYEFESDAAIHGFLDSFYTSRIGIRMIIGQYLALRECDPSKKDCIGLLNTRVVPVDVARDAAGHAATLCERQFGVAPRVELHGRLDLSFAYVPDHLYYIMLELLKNSMRATVEQTMRTKGLSQFDLDEDDLPPIKVVVADGEDNEDVALKVSDEGGGIARSNMPRVWSYLFTTGANNIQEDFVSSDASDFVGAPLAGLGYGLPISRAYCRYFGGDLTLMSMEGYGTDAFVYLSRLGDHDEPLS